MGQNLETILNPSGEDVKLFHKDQKNPRAPSFDKSLILSVPNQNFDKHKIVLSDKVAGNTIQTILSEGKVLMLKRLCLDALPVMIGWPVR